MYSYSLPAHLVPLPGHSCILSDDAIYPWRDFEIVLLPEAWECLSHSPSSTGPNRTKEKLDAVVKYYVHW